MLWNMEVDGNTLIFAPDSPQSSTAQTPPRANPSMQANFNLLQVAAEQVTATAATATLATATLATAAQETEAQATAQLPPMTAEIAATALPLATPSTSTARPSSVPPSTTSESPAAVAKKKRPTRLGLQETYVDNISTFTGLMLEQSRQQTLQLSRMATSLEVLNDKMSHFIEYVAQREM